MLLAIGERELTTIMDEQRAKFVCSPVPFTLQWLFAAFESDSKGQSSSQGSPPTMWLLSRPSTSPFCGFLFSIQRTVLASDTGGRRERAVFAKNDAQQTRAQSVKERFGKGIQ